MDLPTSRAPFTTESQERPIDPIVIAAIVATIKGEVMRRVALTIFAPVLAVSAVALNMAYPSPAELWASMQPVPTVSNPVPAGASNVPSIAENLSQTLPRGPLVAAADDNEDCFQDLAIADARKLDRCGRYVYQALIEIERANGTDTVRQAMESTDRGRLVQQLKLAATEVCRVKWARGSINATDLSQSQACEVSQIRLASDVQ